MFIQQLVRGVESLSKNKIGAIIVLEGTTSLKNYIDSGIKIGGELNADIISTLFWPGTPTHDGAIIVKDGSIEAASCYLPLTETPIPDRRIGTRHRAALGLSETTDAFIIVVSEESGIISIAENGTLTRYLTKESLETQLFNQKGTPGSQEHGEACDRPAGIFPLIFESKIFSPFKLSCSGATIASKFLKFTFGS